MKILNVKGLGTSNTKVITKNNTYIFDRKNITRTDVINNCYLEFETNKKGQITGIIEVFFSKNLINGRMTEKIISQFGNVNNLV